MQADPGENVAIFVLASDWPGQVPAASSVGVSSNGSSASEACAARLDLSTWPPSRGLSDVSARASHVRDAN